MYKPQNFRIAGPGHLDEDFVERLTRSLQDSHLRLSLVIGEASAKRALTPLVLVSDGTFGFLVLVAEWEGTDAAACARRSLGRTGRFVVPSFREGSDYTIRACEILSREHGGVWRPSTLDLREPGCVRERIERIYRDRLREPMVDPEGFLSALRRCGLKVFDERAMREGLEDRKLEAMLF